MSRRTITLAATVTIYMALTNYAAAADSDYGKRAGQWASDQLSAIWLAAIGFGACAFLFPGARKPALLFGFLAAVFITGLFIFAPGTVEFG